MKISRAFFYSILLLLSISCNENNPISVVQEEIKDSQLINTSENIISHNPNLDISQLDLIYFPEEYTVLKMTNRISKPPIARVIYSRPRVQGRKIFGGIIKYDSAWRLGANESTEIQFFKPVEIQGNNIPAGRYILYCIPKEKSWTLVLNSNIDSWGLRMDPSKDLYRFTVPVIQSAYNEEYFSMNFEGTGNGMNLVMSWDNILARLPITIKK